jgi:hypothetical protein
MKKILVVSVLALALINAGCVSSTANPVPLAQVGDDTKSCNGITNEMQQMINKRLEAEGDRNAQVGGNVALGVLGVFLIVPWFFMDTGNAATVEERAAQARFDRLQQMAIERNCPSVPVYQPPGQTDTMPTQTNGSSTVERITLTNPTTATVTTASATKVVTGTQTFEVARDLCAKTLKENTEAYGNCVLSRSRTKPAVVAQVGYNQVCQNIGFKKDSAPLNACVSQLLSRPTN